MNSPLLLPFELDIKGGFSESIGEQYKAAKKEMATMIDGNKPFTLSLFKVMDDLCDLALKGDTAEVDCRRGCGHCCLQMVCCTKLEMEEILNYLQHLPKKPRRSLTNKAIKRAIKYNKIHEEISPKLNWWEDSSILYGDDGMNLRNALHGMPCIYLRPNKTCSIYPVRPVDCRSARSKDDFCETTFRGSLIEYQRALGSRKLKFNFDQIASDLLSEKAMELEGELRIVPLHAWILSTEYSSLIK